MKAKTSVKYHYIKRNTEVQFLRPRKKCNKNRETFAGQGLETKLENCRKELDSYKDWNVPLKGATETWGEAKVLEVEIW